MSSNSSPRVPELKSLAPARIKWALELLELTPDSSVIEIGCGSGIAAQRICEQLTGAGTYMGVDQSKAACDAAFARCKAYTPRMKAIFWNKPFDASDREPALFDRVLAVNVNIFWTGDGEQLRDIRRIMHHETRLVLVYETPSTEQRSKIARILKQRLEPLFGSVTTKLRTVAGKPMLAAIAEDVFRRRNP